MGRETPSGSVVTSVAKSKSKNNTESTLMDALFIRNHVWTFDPLDQPPQTNPLDVTSSILDYYMSDSCDGYISCLVATVCIAAMFLSLMFLDIAGDELGIIDSLPLLCISLGVPMVILGSFAFLYFQIRQDQTTGRRWTSGESISKVIVNKFRSDSSSTIESDHNNSYVELGRRGRDESITRNKQ
jgi:hypothetical protein